MQSLRDTFPSARGVARGLALPALIVVLGTLARATAPAPGTTALAGAAQGESKKITVVVGHSQHMNLPWPAKGVSISDPAIADVQILTPQVLQVAGKSVGTTNVLAWNETGQTLEATIEVSSDLGRLSAELASVFPGTAIKLSQSQNAVLVTGAFARAEQADILHRYLDAQKVNYVDLTTLAGVQQVQVQVRMAEVSRTAIRALGVNSAISGTDAFGVIAPGNLLSGSLVSGAGGVFDRQLGSSITLFGGLTNGDLTMFVRALAENQYLRVLAEPSLVALSGAEAKFLAGGEVPIPVVQNSGGTNTAGAISIEFKPFGISLKFRPTVIGEGGIRLEVASEVSEVSETIETVTQNGPVRTPAFLTRRAETTLEMKSGQTFAMAGLLSERTTAVSSRIPGFGDLPILGALFRSVEYKKGDTELLVLVTATLVEPVSQLSLPLLPGDSHTHPTDWELYFEGRIGGTEAPPASGRDARSMRALGFDRLRGPGAWMGYEQAPAVSTAPSASSPASGGSTPPDGSETPVPDN